jgi:hypothetical protein
MNKINTLAMRIVTFLIFIVSAIKLNAQISTYYVNPDSGNDTNVGSIDYPFKTISKGVSAIGTNGILYLRGGTYLMSSKLNLSKNGQQNNYIKIWAYQNEKVIIDCNGNSSDGISISGSYYYLKGIEVKNTGHNGINISGNYNIIENCIVHENKNTGLHLTGSGTGPSNNLILNCDAHNNFDPPIGGNADGFSAKWTVGPGNVFRDCRSWNNSDDGWDLWMCTGTITIDSCFSFRNGVDIWHTGQVDGNGNGFKLGGNNVATPHIVKNCVAFDNAGNGGKGFDENNNLAGQTIYNCTAFRNKGPNFSLPSQNIQGQHIVKNCISFQGNISIKNCIQEKNSWQGFTVTAQDFASIDTSAFVLLRNPDGGLPKSNFLRLVNTSSLVDAGVDVGIPYNGSAPDLGAFETSGSTAVVTRNIPDNYLLKQNYPNPFNPSTIINYLLPVVCYVTLKVYDVLGNEIDTLVSKYQTAGEYKIIFNGSALPTGIYFYRISTPDFVQIKKMILMK